MEWLLVEDSGEVRRLTLNRPERKNAVPADGWADLAQAFREFESSDARVLVIAGAGGDFCAGADLDAGRRGVTLSVTERHQRMKVVGEAAMTLHRLSKPTLAVVEGVAVGAGMNLAIGCDVVVATPTSRFSEIFVKRGLTLDFGGSWLLPRIVGLQRARELALSGRIVSGVEAAEIGLVTRLAEPEELEAVAVEIASALAQGAPKAQMFAKQALNASFGMSLAEALSWEGQSQAILLGTEDHSEAVEAFLEKRDPMWRGQ